MRTRTPLHKKRVWETRLKRLAAAAERAADDVLVGIYEARQDGVTQADIAYMIGGASPSIIQPKADKGEKILAERKGKSA